MAYWHQSVLSIAKVHKTSPEHGGTRDKAKMYPSIQGSLRISPLPLPLLGETWARRRCGDVPLIKFVSERSDTCELCWGCAKPVKIAIVGQLVSKGAVSKQVPSVKSPCGQLWAAAHGWRECPETRVQRSFSKSCWSLRCVNWFGTTARKRVGEAACAPAVKTALTLASCTQRTRIGASARKLAFPKNVVSSAAWSMTQTSIHTCGNHVVSFCSEKKGF